MLIRKASDAMITCEATDKEGWLDWVRKKGYTMADSFDPMVDWGWYFLTGHKSYYYVTHKQYYPGDANIGNPSASLGMFMDHVKVYHRPYQTFPEILIQPYIITRDGKWCESMLEDLNAWCNRVGATWEKVCANSWYNPEGGSGAILIKSKRTIPATAAEKREWRRKEGIVR